MGVNAALGNLVEHLSPPSNLAKRHRLADMDSLSSPSFDTVNLTRRSATNLRARTVSSGATLVQPASPSATSHVAKSAPTTATCFPDIFAEPFGTSHDINYIYQYLESTESELLSQTNILVDKSVKKWLKYIDGYLAELMRLEGRGRFVIQECNGCASALDRGVGLRCDDCDDWGLYCLTCCLGIHACLPLHRIRRWTGDRFEVVELSLLGLRIHLGHGISERCPHPALSLPTSFVVLDLSGIHEVAVVFCGCKDALPHHVQLLRHRLFPATFVDPHTAATFRLLEHFSVMSSQSNLAPLGYYRSLLRVTVNNGVSPPTNRLAAFLVMTKEWQLLKTLKGSGTGNNSGGVAATSQDDCALDCPACPSPSKDVSDAFGDPSPKQSWLRRLSSILRSRIQSKRGVVSKGRRSDSSLENGGRAVKVTKCPHGLISVRSAEDQTAPILDNSDLVESPFASSVLLPDDSYFLSQSGEKAPDAVPLAQPPSDDDKYQQPPRGYEDVLDSAFGSWNWDKVTALPMTLLLDAQDAQMQCGFHEGVRKAITESVPGECVDLWRRMLADWEVRGERAPNPFKASHSHLSQIQVRLDLYRQDMAAIRSGEAVVVGSDDTPTTILALGLDLEEEQRQLHAAFSCLDPQSSGLQRARLVEAQARLRRRIDAWHDIAQILIPGIKSHRTQSGEDTRNVPAQYLPLFLPSAIHAELSLPSDRYLLEYELRLREAQAYDALADLRGHLGVIAYMRAHAERSPSVQRADQTNLVVGIIQDKVSLGVTRYRKVYGAVTTLAILVPETPGQAYLQELKDDDVRYISQAEEEDRVQPSWIWRFGRTSHLAPDSWLDLRTNRDLNEAFRVEWCHASTQAQNITKKLQSVRQEMDRSVVYHRQRAYWWEAQVDNNFENRPDYFEGANSYAHQQARLSESMRDHCNIMWMCVSGDGDN